jgi:hypothetical protein
LIIIFKLFRKIGIFSGGYEGDSSDDNNSQSDDYLGWGSDEYGGVSLPNFWLIMEVSSDHVITYFHCRYANFAFNIEYSRLGFNVAQPYSNFSELLAKK